MNQRQRALISIVAAGAVLGLLIWLTIARPPDPGSLLPGFLFLVLIVFTHTFGVPLAGGRASLLPTTTLAAFLVLGSVPAGWVALLGALLHGGVRYHWARELEQPRLQPLAALGVAAVNAAFQTLSILAGGAVYQWRGGSTPYVGASWRQATPLVPLAITYLGLNLLLAGIYMAVQGRQVLERYLRSLHRVLLFESWPLIFAPFMALTYLRLGLGRFGLLGLGIVVVSLVMRNLSLARQRLERRVAELDSLQAVGQALSASLDLEAILDAIYRQVGRLMPADNCYVALYDRRTDEVSFPLAIESGQPVRWRSRQMGQGLTEHVLRERAPLLIESDFENRLAALGLAQIGRPATSWLGVPILAGAQNLGVIAVQSYSRRQSYDRSHQEVLVTIAAQAAVAIQNARLYARTDEALARRVQELDSILQTTQEGILLLDPAYRVVAANRALSELLGLAQAELQGQVLSTAGAQGESPLLDRIGYTAQELAADCQGLTRGQGDRKSTEIVVSEQAKRYIARTLTPVHDREGLISGWLLIFHDRTEERELARLRQELTDMLVHDLRSPLTVMLSSLELIELDLAPEENPEIHEVLPLAKQSGEQMLRLLNNLLEIGRLESGQVVIRPHFVDMAALIEAVAARLTPLAAPAQIKLEVKVEADLPPIQADPEIMDRVLHNLVDNAIKYSPDGGRVQIWARLDGQGPDAAMLIGVSDEGPGIPTLDRPLLFQKFKGVRDGGARRRGTGLGLPFCKLAVEAHGGQIWLEDRQGWSSTFVLRLPLSPERG